MRRSERILSAAVVATIAAMAGAQVTVAAEDGLSVQVLSKPLVPGKVNAALWTREAETYSLQVVVPPRFVGNIIECLRGLDPTFGARASAVQGTPSQGAQGTRPEDIATVAEALNRLLPQNIATYQPVIVNTAAEAGSRVALDRPPRITQVWLLRADGTQILPVSRSTSSIAEKSCAERHAALDARARLLKLDSGRRYDDVIDYRFPAAESEQAVAAAFRIDEEYYIEKLQPLVPRQAQ
jgi:hypothetical protein